MTEGRLDLGTGFRLSSELGKRKKASASMGFAAFHFFTNQESFFTSSNEIKIPTRLNGHLFVNRRFGTARTFKWDLSLGGIYNWQAGLNTFTIMLYPAYENFLKLGVGYRGKNKLGNEAIIVQLTFWGKELWEKNDWLFTVGYETSNIQNNPGQHRTGGTLEAGIVIHFDNTILCSKADLNCFHPNKLMKRESIWGL